MHSNFENIGLKRRSIFILQVVDVISGKYDDSIGSVLIVDCRYPYEYDGGHVPVCLP